MSALSNLIVKITADISEFSRDLKRAASDMRSVGDSFESIGTRMSTAITLPLAGVGLAALKVSSQMEQAKVSFTTLLGSSQAAGKYLQELADFAKKTPFELPELVKASQRMVALGFSSKQVIPYLTTIGDAVAALGGSSEMVNRVVTALGQMQQKGRVSAEEMNQLAEVGINGFKLLADASGKSVAEIRKLSEKGLIDATKAIPVIMEGLTKQFGGNMAKQSETLAGMWSNLKDSITLTLNDIGQALIPWAKNAIKEIQPLLDKIRELAGAFKEMSPGAQTGVIGIGAFAAVIGPAIMILGSLISNIGVITGALGKLGVAFGGGKLLALGWVGAITAGVIALGELAYAFGIMNAAQNQSEKAQKNYGDAILILESRLRAHGADISRLKEEYRAGQISQDQYAAGLRKMASGLSAATAATSDHAAATVKAKSASDAFLESLTKGDKISADEKRRLNAQVDAYGEMMDRYAAWAKDYIEKATKLNHLNEEFDKAQAHTQLMFGKAHESMREQALKTVQVLQSRFVQVPVFLSDALEESAKNASKAPSVFDPIAGAASKSVAETTVQINRIPDFVQAVLDKTKKVAAAMSSLGIDKAVTVETVNFLREQFRIYAESGRATAEGLLRGFIKYEEARQQLARATGQVVTREQERALKDAKAKLDSLDGAMNQTSRNASKMAHQISTVMTDLSRGIAQAIIQGKSIGDVFAKVAVDIAEAILRVAIEKGIKVLINNLDVVLSKLGSIGKKIADVFGSGASSIGGSSSSGGGIPGVGGGGGSTGSSLGSGLSGWITAGAGVVEAISSVVGNFQFAHMNTALGRIEESTRYSKAYLLTLIEEAYKYWPRLLNIEAGTYGLNDIRLPIFQLRDTIVEGRTGGTPVQLTIDGRTLAQALMPYLSRQVQVGVG